MDRRLTRRKAAIKFLNAPAVATAVLVDDRDLNDYEVCDVCGCRMTWTAAQPFGDALACDDCVWIGKAKPIAD